ncbi:MAG TPA: hypothetical protein VMI30_02710, partial [Stellaceae bacterium]|nr:hypothetical protein [Stellaceae bacterium]
MFVDDLINDMQIAVDPVEKTKAIVEISNCFLQKDDSAYKAPCLTLVVKNKSDIRPWENLQSALPAGSYFSGSRTELSDIFQRGAHENRLDWAEAVDIFLRRARNSASTPQFDLKWLAELVDVMHEAKEKSYRERPIYGLVFAGDKTYSPVIHEIAERRDGSLCCEIIFLKWEGKEYPNAPEGIRTLIMSIRVATRFRQEFLEIFKEIGRKAKYEMRRSELGAQRFRQRVWRAFYDVMTESTIRGLSIDGLDRVFNAAGRDALYEMAEEFSKAQKRLSSLLGANADLSTSIVKENDEEFSDNDIVALEEIYKIFDDVNLKFLAMAHKPMDEYFSSFASPERWDAVKNSVTDVGPVSADRASSAKPLLQTSADPGSADPASPEKSPSADDKVIQISDHRG